MSFQICVAQLNLVVGDLPGNARQIIDAAHAAHARGARLLLTPELSLGGYIAEDLFLRPAFVAACDDALNQVARESALRQALLPNYQVFDERRYFVSGRDAGRALRVRGRWPCGSAC
jgi:predicted amidohydrolase